MNTEIQKSENDALDDHGLDAVAGGFHAFGYTFDVEVNGTSATAVVTGAVEGVKAGFKLGWNMV